MRIRAHGAAGCIVGRARLGGREPQVEVRRPRRAWRKSGDAATDEHVGLFTPVLPLYAPVCCESLYFKNSFMSFLLQHLSSTLHQRYVLYWTLDPAGRSLIRLSVSRRPPPFPRPALRLAVVVGVARRAVVACEAAEVALQAVEACATGASRSRTPRICCGRVPLSLSDEEVGHEPC